MTTKSRIAKVERYRIAQTFHELSLAGKEAFIAASQLSAATVSARMRSLLSRTSSRTSRFGGFEG